MRCRSATATSTRRARTATKAEVGAGIRDSGVVREGLFPTTKVPMERAARDEVRAGAAESLRDRDRCGVASHRAASGVSGAYSVVTGAVVARSSAPAWSGVGSVSLSKVARAPDRDFVARLRGEFAEQAEVGVVGSPGGGASAPLRCAPGRSPSASSLSSNASATSHAAGGSRIGPERDSLSARIVRRPGGPRARCPKGGPCPQHLSL
jgi:hypothetical protein